MSMYKNFKTSADLESKGIELDYGEFIVTIARAGGANNKFKRVTERMTKPYRRAMATNTMDNEVAENLMREIYAEAVILDWQTKTGETKEGGRTFEKGIEPPTGDKLLPVTKENIVLTLKNLPDLFQDIQSQAQTVALFRQNIVEDDAGN